MEECVFGTTRGDLKGLSWGSIPPFPTKNQGVIAASMFLFGWSIYLKLHGLHIRPLEWSLRLSDNGAHNESDTRSAHPCRVGPSAPGRPARR